ncbi:MAG: peptide chain release factor 2 [Nitrospirae bacterium]|nr:peptide chain release factor 2 [Nitrospirota bacterium]
MDDLSTYRGRLAGLKHDVGGLIAHRGVEKLSDELADISLQMEAPAFWDDPDAAQLVSRRRSQIEKTLDDCALLRRAMDDLDLLVELAAGEKDDSLLPDIAAGLDQLADMAERRQVELMLSGEADHYNAFVTIHPGAGGTESADWAGMLYRMYNRYVEQAGWEFTLLDYQPGEEAGIKSVTFQVTGDYAYGYLKCEAGVHRLVRISPFDAAKRRHTSFASVFVSPDVPDDVEVEVEEKDLRVDIFRSSGAGGQHVNKTSSAVRLTHIPTGIVVSCQNERSQHQNRAQAMKVLKARLYERALAEHEAKLKEMVGEKMDNAWGSQIRSYVFHPYQMVKDHRTGHETGNLNAVMDGALDPFIRAYLLHQMAASGKT